LGSRELDSSGSRYGPVTGCRIAGSATDIWTVYLPSSGVDFYHYTNLLRAAVGLQFLYICTCY